MNGIGPVAALLQIRNGDQVAASYLLAEPLQQVRIVGLVEAVAEGMQAGVDAGAIGDSATEIGALAAEKQPLAIAEADQAERRLIRLSVTEGVEQVLEGVRVGCFWRVPAVPGPAEAGGVGGIEAHHVC